MRYQLSEGKKCTPITVDYYARIGKNQPKGRAEGRAKGNN
jgi:hypothetical protein